MIRIYILVLVVAVVFVKRLPAQVNYYRLSAEGVAGLSRYNGDLGSVRPWTVTSRFSGGYRFLPYLVGLLELEQGHLSGGDSIRDPFHRYFRNRFVAGLLGVKVTATRPGLLPAPRWLNLVRSCYLLAGTGWLHNQLVRIRRTEPYRTGLYRFPGENSSNEQLFVLAAGTQWQFRDRWHHERLSIGLEWRLSGSDGEGIDGYNDPGLIFNNRHRDAYATFSLGIGYLFGPMGFYWKR